MSGFVFNLIRISISYSTDEMFISSILSGNFKTNAPELLNKNYKKCFSLSMIVWMNDEQMIVHNLQ